MDQLASTAAGAKSRSTAVISPMKDSDSSDDFFDHASYDCTSGILDDCLACIFQSLSSGDRKRCSLVCRRWLRIEGQSRNRLSLNVISDLAAAIPSVFSRFDAVTKLGLKCDRRSVSIGDEALVLFSLRVRNLNRLKLSSCRELTDAGIEAFANNCKGLKKLSCGPCTFGSKGMNVVFHNCSFLQELLVKRLLDITDAASAQPIGSVVTVSSLRVICLKELYNGQCFRPLLIGSKNLKMLKLFRCSSDWDKLLETMPDEVSGLVEVHLERLQVSDAGLATISNCSRQEILHLVKTPECTNFGLKNVAEHCKLLWKLHIDGWKTNRISDDGLVVVAMNCPNLQELVLIGVNPTRTSLEKLATNCVNLKILALCGSESVGDPELCCIASKCTALKKLCIKNCPMSDHGMRALADGCPNLIKVKVKKCRLVTSEGADWLRGSRGSIAVNLDNCEQLKNPYGSHGGGGAPGQEYGGVSSSGGRSTSFKARIGLIAGRNLVASTFRRWSSFGGRTG